MAPLRDKRPGEFGGVPGRIQPAPHEPTNSETLSLIYATETAAPIAPGQTIEEVVPATKRIKK
jgi:hypothetical protein